MTNSGDEDRPVSMASEMSSGVLVDVIAKGDHSQRKHAVLVCLMRGLLDTKMIMFSHRGFRTCPRGSGCN